MSIAESFLPEFDMEMANTRKVLERVPEGKFGWKPHEKSGTMGWLADHCAFLPGWCKETFTLPELDLSVFPFRPLQWWNNSLRHYAPKAAEASIIQGSLRSSKILPAFK